MISLHPYKAIVAVSKNGVIGKDGGLPWKLSEDLKWFKKITMGHTVLMGRKTWESLPFPLPGRKNWVTKSLTPSEGMETFASFGAVERELKPEEQLFVIGGGEIYVPKPYQNVQKFYITEVPLTISDGDAFFPDIKKTLKWSKPWFRIKISHYADGKEFSSKAVEGNKPKGL